MINDSIRSASFVNDSVNSENPWLGLHPFTEELHEFFYGRDNEADELQRRVNRKTLTVLFGQSGLGKTSLLRAGLFPRLRRAGFLPFTVRIVHAEDAPSPAAQIISALAAAAKSANAALLSPHAAPETALWEYFHHIDFSLRSEAGKPLVPVLVFDQFEEVFTLGAETESLRQRGAALLTELADLVENRPPQELLARFEADPEIVEKFQFDRADYRVLLSLREDYLANLEDMRARMPSLSENRMRLTRMNGEQALDAVSKPGGQLVTPVVSRQIVRFVSGAPPTDEDRTDVDLAQYEVDPAMLSLFCAELNNRRRAQELPQITADLLAGSRDTILRDYYERCLADVHSEVRRFVEDELLTDLGYRVDVPLEKAQKTLTQKGAADDALDSLVKRRLLRIEERLHVRRVELTHDVLTSIVRQSRDERQQREEAILAKGREERIRSQLRKARRRLAATVVAAASIIAIIATGFYVYLDWWVWPHDAYYNTFAKRRGVIVGIGELSERSHSARNASFKITTIGRGHNARVIAMAAVDSYGELTADHGVSTYLTYASESDAPSPSRECRWEYIYDKDGRIVYEKAFDKHGKMVWCFVYSPTAGVEKSGDRAVETAHGHFIGEDGYPRPQRNSSAEYVEIQYSPEGWEHIRKYSDRNGRPQPGLDRAYGMSREYNELGELTKTLSLDEKGQPMIDSGGNCGLAYGNFDSLGNAREFESFGTSGEPMPVTEGWIKEREEYDEHGNLTATWYFDAADRPARVADGYAGYLSSYDRRGHVVKRSYVDEQGRLTTGNFGYAGWTASYDSRGHEIERRYFGLDEKPARSRTGVTVVRYERDVNGLVTKQSFFDPEGNPALSTEAVAGWTSEYDDVGQETRRLFFNAQGEPTLINTEKIAGWTAGYDDRGNRVKRSSLGLDGGPSRSSNGYVTEEARYDDFGNQIWLRFLDESGRPTRHKDGYAGYRAEYDGQGNRVRVSTFDEEEKPLSYKGVFGWTSEFDKLGNETARRLLDQAGNPAKHVDGYVSWVTKYDSSGHEIERRYLDSSGKLVSLLSGIAYYTVKYNQQGRPLERAYFGASGDPGPISDGYTRVAYEYDAAGRERKETYVYEVRPHPNGHRREAMTLNEQGQVTKIEYLDAAGKPMLNSERIARVEQERDSRGLVARRAYFDTEGKPTLDVNGTAGWTAKYDVRGNEIERRYFDLAGKPTMDSNKVAVMLMHYDDRGNETRRAYFDLSDKPTLSGEEVAGWTSRYDAINNEVERQFFDVADKPSRIKYGYVKWTARYNELRKVVERAYLDDAGKPASQQDGYSRAQYEYDEKGRERRRMIFYESQPHPDGQSAEIVDIDENGQVVSRSFLDAEGRPMLTKKDVARVTFERDAKGRITRQSYFDVDGRPTLSDEGVAVGTFTFDDRGNVLELRVFGTDGKPILPKGVTYSRWTARYDENGKILDKAYFDDADKPAALNDGYNRVGYEYDSDGRERKRTFFYEVKPHPDGYAAEAWTYDEKGQITASAFLDAAGLPTVNKNLIASIHYERDDQGMITRQEFFDGQGRPTLSNEEIAGWTSKFDPQGKESERQYFNTDGKPTLLKDTSFAKWTAAYAFGDRILNKAYFDASDKPAPSNDGYTRIHNEYDQGGRLKSSIEEFETNSDPQGVRSLLRVYDDKERVKEISYQDASAKRVPNADGFYRITLEYDDAGDLTSKRFYYQLEKGVDAASDATAPAKDEDEHSLAYAQEQYASGNKLVVSSYHHRDGSLAKGPEGWARQTNSFDNQNARRESVYVDEFEKPVQMEVRVSEIVPGSQSEKLKLQENDVLTTYDGEPVTDASSFIYRRSKEPADQGTKPLVIRRGTEELSVDVATGPLGASIVDRAAETPSKSP